MKTSDIKNIMIVFSDNDFVRVFDWIGKITLSTIKNKNICDEYMLEDSETIENFVHSLLPTAIEFIQYKVGKYERYCRYQDVKKDHVKWLSDEFNYIRFVYNFDETHDDYRIGGCETLIIDLEKNESYIR